MALIGAVGGVWLATGVAAAALYSGRLLLSVNGYFCMWRRLFIG